MAPTCAHLESLHGRCTACGMTWEQQAEARARRAAHKDATSKPDPGLSARAVVRWWLVVLLVVLLFWAAVAQLALWVLRG